VRNFDFIIDGVLAGCSRPFTGGPDDDLKALKERGMAAIVTLTQDPLDAGAVGRAGLDYLHLPVRDFGAPDAGQIERLVDFVRRVRAGGKGAVAVHCGSGYGRTGTMLACYLVSEGRTAEEAMAEVRRRRPGSIESAEQEEAVRGWESRVLPARHRGAEDGGG
jgi:atypical dual specificity phosphatase